MSLWFISHCQSKKTAEKTLKLMDKVGSSLLGTKAVGEKPSVFKTKSLAMMLDRQVPSKIGGKKLGDKDGDGGVALPSASTLFGDKTRNLPSVDSQVKAAKRLITFVCYCHVIIVPLRFPGILGRQYATLTVFGSLLLPSLYAKSYPYKYFAIRLVVLTDSSWF